MTQEELAEKIGCSTSYISYIETGVKRLSLDYFIKAANILGCSADELLIDQLSNTLDVKAHLFANLMQDCEEFEQQILYEVIGATKISLRKYARAAKQPRR